MSDDADRGPGAETPKHVWPDVPRTAFAPATGYTYSSAAGSVVQRQSLTLYAIGYADAAKAVFAATGGPGRANDVLLFPLGLLWRHAFELLLKEIIWRGREIAAQGKGTFPEHHRLDKLWAIAVPLILPLGGDEGADAPEIKNVGAIIGELHAIDETGQAFRYPTLRDGARALDGIPSVLDLEGFQDAMLAVYNFLDTVSTMMREYHGELLHREWEMQATYERDREE